MLPVREREETVVDVFARAGDGPLLDVGCGDGALTARLGEACGTDELYGVDVSEEAIERANERGIRASVVDLDEDPLPFEDDRFAAVHCGEVIDYLNAPDRLLSEVQRCLAPGGLFVLTTPNLASVHNRAALLLGRLPYPMRGEYDRLVGDDDGPSPLSKRPSVFTHGILRTVLPAHGLEVVTVMGVSSVPPESSVWHRLVERIAVTVPSLSYRNVYVCRNVA